MIKAFKNDAFRVFYEPITKCMSLFWSAGRKLSSSFFRFRINECQNMQIYFYENVPHLVLAVTVLWRHRVQISTIAVCGKKDLTTLKCPLPPQLQPSTMYP